MGSFSIWHWVVVLILGGIVYSIYRSAHPKSIKHSSSPKTASGGHTSSGDKTQNSADLYERVADEFRQKTLKQGLWAKAFAEADGDKAKAQAAYIRYRVSELQNIQNTSADIFTSKSEKPSLVRPWVRYWARIFDVYSFSLVSGVILEVVAPQFLAKQNEYILGMMLVFAWVFIEAFLLTLFQTTPGKWLFKTNIALSSGTSISFSQAFSRSLKVWWRGFGTGFPIAAIITMIVAYGRLTRNGITSWDKDDGFLVTHEIIGVPRVLAAIAFFLAFLVVVALGNTPNA